MDSTFWSDEEKKVMSEKKHQIIQLVNGLTIDKIEVLFTDVMGLIKENCIITIPHSPAP